MLWRLSATLVPALEFWPMTEFFWPLRRGMSTSCLMTLSVNVIVYVNPWSYIFKSKVSIFNLCLFVVQVLAEKIYRLSDNITCTVAGITADANILINHLRQCVTYLLITCFMFCNVSSLLRFSWAAHYKLGYGEEMPVEQLVQTLCNEKQRYTQIGGRYIVWT